MKSKHSVWQRAAFTLALFGAVSATAIGQVFTVQVGSPSSPPVPLVNHGDTWRYRLGTTEPQAGWTNIPDASLDGTWLSGPGGIGYNDGDDSTDIRAAMSNICTTVYIRRTFTLGAPVSETDHLRLVMDYDDAFVAYLDGQEILRANTTNGVGTFVAHNATTVSHEALGYQGLPVDVFDLGLVGSRLGAGPHVLALIGINQAITSSDLTLIPDLSVVPDSPVIGGPLLAIVHSSSVTLFGSNTIAGSTRVLVNGTDATFNPALGRWTNTVALTPGYNRVLIQAADATGIPLQSLFQVVVSEQSSTSVGGTLPGNATWGPSMGVIHLTSSVTVPPGATLNIQTGAVVLLGSGMTLRATDHATINLEGSGDNIVVLAPADGGANMWGEVAADGTNSFLTLRHAELIAGAIKFRNGATGLMEDSYVHDFKNGTTPIGGCTRAKAVTVRRCHFRIYYETLWQFTPMTFEEDLFELANEDNSDALDFDSAPVGSVIRNCTFRHGTNSNTDAIDLGPGSGGPGSRETLVENCFIYNFPSDKGVSVGEGSFGTIVTNCLIDGNRSGVAAKDTPGDESHPCTVTVFNCTIVNCIVGFTNYNKSIPGSPTGGGQTTNSYNNILWNNLASISLINGGTLTADHSDFGGTNWPGDGNLSADPLFENPAQHDYRLKSGSPCLGTGRDGANMGCSFPVGAAMALSHPRIESIEHTGDTALLKFWVDSEKTYSLLRSTNVSGGAWEKVADAFPYPNPRLLTVTNSLVEPSNYFYRLVTPRQ